MKKPLLSVIIPVYNVEKYIKEAVDSLYGDYPSHQWEVLLINDGSTDHSLKECIELQKHHDNIKVISQQNQGLSGARNTGINNAEGEYIMFLDSDDAVVPNTIPEILTSIQEVDPDVIMGRCLKYNGEVILGQCQFDYAILKGLSPVKAFKIFLDRGAWFAAWLLIIKSNFLRANNLMFYPGIYHEDELWVPRTLLNAKSIDFISSPFYKYRVNREGSIVAGKNIKREFDKFKILQELQKENFQEKLKVTIIKDRCASILYGCIRNLNGYRDDHNYNKLKDMLLDNLHFLKFGKYHLLYYMIKLIGLDHTSQIVNKK